MDEMMDTYLLLKSLHILGVVLFLGNIIVTGWWKFMADRTRNPTIVAFAQRQVTLTDYVFTAGWCSAGPRNGASAMRSLHDMDYLSIKWLDWGYWLFMVSGVIWVDGADSGAGQAGTHGEDLCRQFGDSEAYWRLSSIWYLFGTQARSCRWSISTGWCSSGGVDRILNS